MKNGEQTNSSSPQPDATPIEMSGVGEMGIMGHPDPHRACAYCAAPLGECSRQVVDSIFVAGGEINPYRRYKADESSHSHDWRLVPTHALDLPGEARHPITPPQEVESCPHRGGEESVSEVVRIVPRDWRTCLTTQPGIDKGESKQDTGCTYAFRCFHAHCAEHYREGHEAQEESESTMLTPPEKKKEYQRISANGYLVTSLDWGEMKHKVTENCTGEDMSRHEVGYAQDRGHDADAVDAVADSGHSRVESVEGVGQVEEKHREDAEPVYGTDEDGFVVFYDREGQPKKWIHEAFPLRPVLPKAFQHPSHKGIQADQESAPYEERWEPCGPGYVTAVITFVEAEDGSPIMRKEITRLWRQVIIISGGSNSGQERTYHARPTEGYTEASKEVDSHELLAGQVKEPIECTEDG